MTPEQLSTVLAFQQIKQDIKGIRTDVDGVTIHKAKGINIPVAEQPASGIISIDLAPSDNQLVPITLTGNTTLSLVNAAPGKSLVIVITQGGAGSYSFNLPSECKLPNGVTIDWNLAVGSVTALNLLVVNASYIITTSLKM
ncbi:hypothetical protein [Larkinella harenae]